MREGEFFKGGRFIPATDHPSKSLVDALKATSLQGDQGYFYEWRFDWWLLKGLLKQPLAHDFDLELYLLKMVDSMPAPVDSKYVLFTLRSHRSLLEKESLIEQMGPLYCKSKSYAFQQAVSLLEDVAFRQGVLLKAQERGWTLIDLEVELDLEFSYLLEKAVLPVFSCHLVQDPVINSFTILEPFIDRWKELQFRGFFKACFLFPSSPVLQSVEKLLSCFKMYCLERFDQKVAAKIAVILSCYPLSQLRSELSPLNSCCHLEFMSPESFYMHPLERTPSIQDSPSLGQINISTSSLLQRKIIKQRYALISGSVHRSPGVYLHNLFMKRFIPNTKYLALPLGEADAQHCLEGFFRGIDTSDGSIGNLFHGLSISSPYKSLLYQMLQSPLESKLRCSDHVAITSTCNTLVRREKGYFAENTDVKALAACLALLKIDRDSPIVILGGGSCAMAFVKSLITWGYKNLAICARKKPVFDVHLHSCCTFFPWIAAEDASHQKTLEAFMFSKAENPLIIQASGVESEAVSKSDVLGLYPFCLLDCFNRGARWIEINNTLQPRLSVTQFVREGRRFSDGIGAQDFFAIQAAFQASIWFSDQTDEILRDDFYSYFQKCSRYRGWRRLQEFGMDELALFCYHYFRTQLETGACGRYFHPMKEP